MKKMVVFQISTMLIISGGLLGMFIFTDVYEDVQSNIVLVLCLSCMKLEVKTIKEFTFDTANGKPHPDFVLNNLHKGPVFLHYSENACPGCDIMFPIIKNFFNVEFRKNDIFNETVYFQNSNISYFYIYRDNSSLSQEMKDSLQIYDKDHVHGLPMFSVVTLGYDRGIVRPYYTSLYGTLGFDNDQERINLLMDTMQESIDLYNQNFDGFNPNST
jgi:hypothetical protein